ncbi:hypothetical protein SAMN05444161_5657 [Rhizobiales bacterium GAS191]|jgi:hypothetical protein|nr:hypothetical protein SAMN05519103_04852 [Rhizobiales bacterium GAS113]SEE17551.1 hypothetical protein SAMN05519104_5404 [Rhizobiales bacterium GAS188]SEE40438.1 hypothetical protein SAMN05444161_5657 [Rhizobiales bacterium GAS191]
MAKNPQSITKPLHGLAKVILDGSTNAKRLAVAAIAGSRAKFNRAHANAYVQGDEADGKEEPGRGPDDRPTDREKRDTPTNYGA